MPKVAILIDGAYLLNRLPEVRRDINPRDARAVADAIMELVRSHLKQLNRVHNASNYLRLLYRTFYYDAKPYTGKDQRPVSGESINFSESPLAKFRQLLFEELRGRPNVAVRLGEVRPKPDFLWTLKVKVQKEWLTRRTLMQLKDADFSPVLTQKGVDMRIGLDIATITLKHQASIIVLVAGDSDFVQAAKLARREGVQFILDPLWQKPSANLSEHIDRVQSGFFGPNSTSHQNK